MKFRIFRIQKAHSIISILWALKKLSYNQRFLPVTVATAKFSLRLSETLSTPSGNLMSDKCKISPASTEAQSKSKKHDHLVISRPESSQH